MKSENGFQTHDVCSIDNFYPIDDSENRLIQNIFKTSVETYNILIISDAYWMIILWISYWIIIYTNIISSGIVHSIAVVIKFMGEASIMYIITIPETKVNN